MTQEAEVKKFQVPKEDAEQIMLSTWLTRQGIRHSASANGGKRTMVAAIKLKRMGVSPGFPDVEIPYPSGQYHGLYIELKRKKGGVLSSNQVDWLRFLSEQGYYAVRANGFEEAKGIVLWYFALTPKAA